MRVSLKLIFAILNFDQNKMLCVYLSSFKNLTSVSLDNRSKWKVQNLAWTRRLLDFHFGF
jgi:hypothetical protein